MSMHSRTPRSESVHGSAPAFTVRRKPRHRPNKSSSGGGLASRSQPKHSRRSPQSHSSSDSSDLDASPAYVPSTAHRQRHSGGSGVERRSRDGSAVEVS